MKKTILILAVILFIAQSLSARIIIISVGPNGERTFSPSSVTDAIVGDTVRFVWISGVHNTVSGTIPMGAANWSNPIDNTNQIFNYKITVAGTYNYVCTFHSASGMTGSFVASPVLVQENGSVVKDYDLKQNYPNPFNPVTSIKFSIPVNSVVKIKVYSLTGSEVAAPVNENLAAGEYRFSFNGSGLSSGIYFYKIETGNYTQVRKMVLMK
ncbi:MAG: T9SS type A sorting domain-containing protein [Bacteroidetes bacterium]|nr:T9SS type A sorting domain-containing protein [Bacteroidota bacterium]